MAAKKIKILYCITKGNWGGAQKYVYDLATSLSPQQYEVTVLLGTDGALAEKLEEAQIRVLILKNLFRNINIFKDFISLIKLIKIFKKEKPDIIHLNSSKMGLLGTLAGRLAGVPKIIFTGHGWAFNEDRSNLQKKIIFLLHLLTIHLAHKTIAVSSQTKNQVLTKFNNRKIIVIKNGLDKITFFDRTDAREKILEKLPANSNIGNRLWLGTISELHKNKGLKYIIEAMHLLKISEENKANLPILIIIGEGEKRAKLEQRISRYNLNDSIFLVGKIPEAEKYLKALDIFTLTSITEALPYVVLEAGQTGLPIIASSVGGIPEIIDDMENGILVRPKEPDEIKKAIDFLLAFPDKRLILGHKIQEKVLRDFNKEKMVAETMSVYS